MYIMVDVVLCNKSQLYKIIVSSLKHIHLYSIVDLSQLHLMNFYDLM